MAISSESRFFGLDLTQLKADVLKTWRKAPQWPPLSWLRPEQALTLVRAVGTPVVVWESGQELTNAKRQPKFLAIELPEAMVLRKSMQLPVLDPADCASAAELEVQAISPFASSDILWGFSEISRSDTQVRLQLVLASRAQVTPYVQVKTEEWKNSQSGDNKAALTPEVWVLGGRGEPIVIQGFGEAARAKSSRKKMLVNAGSVALAVVLAAVIAITPTAQLRLRAIQATKAFETMAIKATDVVAKREQLMQSADQVATLSDLLAERVDGVKVLSMLTRVLPDDAALQSARIQGTKVTINGLAENASTLMQKLGNQEGVKEVKAPSGASRIQGINKESFTIELMLDSKIFGMALKPEEPVAKPADPESDLGPGTELSSVSQKPGAVETPAVAPVVVPEAKSTVTAPPSNKPHPGPSLGGSSKGPSLGGARPSRNHQEPSKP